MLNKIVTHLKLLLFSMIAGCSHYAPKVDPQVAPSATRISEVKIGESKDAVLAKLGSPSSKSVEKFPETQFEVFEYATGDGKPLGYITFVPGTGTVAGRAQWISSHQAESDFDYLRRNLIPGKKLDRTLLTCDKHHVAELKVDEENGIFVGLEKSKVIYVAWSEPQLAKLRIEQFFLKCPERQKPEFIKKLFGK